ncbi:MAG: hypothetical protein HC769_02750 [Cyanobacteria bacterium CRU_2_1]|nr:hypothetical protein [Cyanobacteria bacterium RU_5_0]NJR57864.1 hypothetical protein [Cyanobacteria bacterium CRU_2_1]
MTLVAQAPIAENRLGELNGLDRLCHVVRQNWYSPAHAIQQQLRMTMI